MKRRLLVLLTVALTFPGRALLAENEDGPVREAYRQASDLRTEHKYDQARLAYGRFLSICPPEHSLVAKALFERAQCLLMLGKTEEGAREMIALSQKHPDYIDAPLALWVAVQFFLLEKPDKEQAWFYGEQLLKKYPDHCLADHLRQHWPAFEKMSRTELARQAKEIKDASKAAKRKAKP